MLPANDNATDKDSAVNFSNYRIENDPASTVEDKRTAAVAEEHKIAPTLNHEKAPHMVATTLFDKSKDRSPIGKLL